jgi:hypothetical protein
MRAESTNIFSALQRGGVSHFCAVRHCFGCGHAVRPRGVRSAPTRRSVRSSRPRGNRSGWDRRAGPKLRNSIDVSLGLDELIPSNRMSGSKATRGSVALNAVGYEIRNGSGSFLLLG